MTTAPGQTSDTSPVRRRALVTGATSGIGRATALRLAQDGFEVIAHGRNAERGAQTVRAIQAAGGQASFIAAALVDLDEVRRLPEQSGEVDVPVNNGGFAWFGPSDTLDAGMYDSMFVDAVFPGPVCTASPADRISAIGETTILERAAQPEEIAQAIAFLVSDAARCISGATIPVDAGRTAI